MAAVLPKLMRVSKWCAVSGLTPDRTYALANEGKLKLKRLGGSTYVDVHHGMAFIDSLPDYREVPTTYWADQKNPHSRRKKPSGSSESGDERETDKPPS